MPKILLNLPDSALETLDALAAERAEPGADPNRSEAMRHLIRLHAAVCRPGTVTVPAATAKGRNRKETK
jgi:hypothetical protein